MLNQLDIQQRIRAERSAIQREGQALGILKDAALNNNQQLPQDYAIQLLRLIRRIIEHDIAYRNQYGVDQARMRRSTLGNLAITARLFRDYNNLIPNNILPNYKSRVPGYDGTNIFDDLAYLCAFDIVVNQNPFGGPLYQLSDQEVARILDEICPVLQEIAASEEAYFQHIGNCPLNININMQTQVGINLQATRNMYTNHMLVPQLFISTSYSKETIHIFKAIRAINTCVDMHFGPPLNHVNQMANRRAILRCLTIVGEAFTQSNLTPATRAFGFLSQAEFQLFKNIRDKLEHSELDIYLNNVEQFITNNHIRPFVAELTLLRALLNLKLRELSRKYNDNSLAIHYFQNNLNNNMLNRFPQIQLFFNNHLRLLKGNLLNQHRQQFPNHFTPQVMAGRIRQEITAINLSLAHAPVDVIQALRNVRPENTALVVEFLQGHPSFRLSIEYHICRIVKFLGEIPIGQQAQLLAPMQEAEIRVFRNIIAHNLNEFMITGLPLEAFIYQYLAIILQRFPLHQGHQQMPPVPGVI